MTYESPGKMLKNPKRILYIFNASWFFLSHRRALANAARRMGYDVHVAAAVSPGDREKIEADGITFHSLPLKRRSLNPFTECMTLATILKLYVTLQPDIVENATVKPVIYGGMVAKFYRNLNVVNWMTGLGYVFISQNAKISILRKLITIVYGVIFNRKQLLVIFENPDDRQQFINRKIVKSEQSVIIRGAGVDTNTFIPSPEGPGCMVILPARMLWDKGVGEFVEAATILMAEGYVNTRFVLVGDSDDGNPAAVPVEILKGWEQKRAVEWWGRCNNMPAVFAQAHIVCLPSYREGLPKVLVEAAAAGRPIVTTDVPGCREVVQDGLNGILIPVKDPIALAVALRTLIENRSLREQMGIKGREMALNKFSEAKIIAETLSVYHELLSQ